MVAAWAQQGGGVAALGSGLGGGRVQGGAGGGRVEVVAVVVGWGR